MLINWLIYIQHQPKLSVVLARLYSASYYTDSLKQGFSINFLQGPNCFVENVEGPNAQNRLSPHKGGWGTLKYEINIGLPAVAVPTGLQKYVCLCRNL